MNVLSLCDGMSCALLALHNAGIEVENYFSAEIKDHAIKLQKHHFVEKKTDYGTYCKYFWQIGDVNKISYKNGMLHFTALTGTESVKEVKIDLVCFGSPCQSFSRAMREERREKSRA